MPFTTILELSTAHLPESDPDFGNISISETKYGWLVFPVHTEYTGNLPEWLQPIVKFAFENGCSLIYFDRDAEVDNQFKTYDW